MADEDSAVAIFGPGEAVDLTSRRRDARAGGWTRRLVLELRGWCKDMDLYTRDGETIEPLPGGGYRGAPAAACPLQHSYASGF